jgi:ABC-type xylose transport system permease subunit
MRHLLDRVVAIPLIFGVAAARAEGGAQQLMCVAQHWFMPSYLTELAGFLAHEGQKLACLLGLHDLQPWAAVIGALETLGRLS